MREPSIRREEEWRTSDRAVVVLKVMIVASVKSMDAALTALMVWPASANRAAVEKSMLRGRCEIQPDGGD
jgi:hypothetical protein